MKYIKFLIIAIFGFCFGLDLKASQQHPKKQTFTSSLAQCEKAYKARVKTEEERREKKSKKKLEKKAKAKEKKYQETAEVEEFFYALDIQYEESGSSLKVSQELSQEKVLNNMQIVPSHQDYNFSGALDGANNMQILPYYRHDQSIIDHISKYVHDSLRNETSSQSAESVHSVAAIDEAAVSCDVQLSGSKKTSKYSSQSSSGARPSLPLFALPHSASRSSGQPSYSNDSKIASSSFLSRNKVAIVAVSALVGGVAYYAATRGLRPETIVKDLKAAKNFCVDNAGKAKEKTIELVGAVKEKTPELKSKFNFGLAAIGSYAISGLNNLKWILENPELE